MEPSMPMKNFILKECVYIEYMLLFAFFIDYVLSSVCYISAVLLLCDYGMFSTPAPSSIERTTIQISNTSDSNTIVTAESTIFGNFTEADEDDELDDERPEPTTNASHENASVPNITVNTSAGPDRNSVEATPRTARPESTTHRRIPLAPPRQRENGWGTFIMLEVFEI